MSARARTGARGLRIPRVLGEQLGGEGASGRALASAGWATEQVRVRRTAPWPQRSAEHCRRVRMAIKGEWDGHLDAG